MPAASRVVWLLRSGGWVGDSEIAAPCASVPLHLCTTLNHTHRSLGLVSKLPLGMPCRRSCALQPGAGVFPVAIGGGLGDAISDSAERLYIGRELTASPERYVGGSIDVVRVWAVARTETQIRSNMIQEMQGMEAGLRGYWKLNSSSWDATGNGNTSVAPVFQP